MGSPQFFATALREENYCLNNYDSFFPIDMSSIDKGATELTSYLCCPAMPPDKLSGVVACVARANFSYELLS